MGLRLYSVSRLSFVFITAFFSMDPAEAVSFLLHVLVGFFFVMCTVRFTKFTALLPLAFFFVLLLRFYIFSIIFFPFYSVSSTLRDTSVGGLSFFPLVCFPSHHRSVLLCAKLGLAFAAS